MGRTALSCHWKAFGELKRVLHSNSRFKEQPRVCLGWRRVLRDRWTSASEGMRCFILTRSRFSQEMGLHTDPVLGEAVPEMLKRSRECHQNSAYYRCFPEPVSEYQTPSHSRMLELLNNLQLHLVHLQVEIFLQDQEIRIFFACWIQQHLTTTRSTSVS